MWLRVSHTFDKSIYKVRIMFLLSISLLMSSTRNDATKSVEHFFLYPNRFINKICFLLGIWVTVHAELFQRFSKLLVIWVLGSDWTCHYMILLFCKGTTLVIFQPFGIVLNQRDKLITKANGSKTLILHFWEKQVKFHNRLPF